MYKLGTACVILVASIGPLGRSQQSCEFPAYGWTRTAAYPHESEEMATDVALDADGNVILAGELRAAPGTLIDLDPTEGVDLHSAYGDQDIFVTKLGPDGSYRWAYIIGAFGPEAPEGVAADRDGNVYVTGWFGQGLVKGYTVDFDPTEGVDERATVICSDAFFTRINANGSYGWTHTLPGTDCERGADVAVGPDGDVIVAGEFGGDLDFDPGEGKDEHSSGRGRDAFVSKFRTDGSYAWTVDFGDDESASAWAIAPRDNGAIAVTGRFSGQVDFDPRPRRVDMHDSGQAIHVFVTLLTPDGTPRWTRTFGGKKPWPEDSAYSYGVATGARGSIWVAGAFRGKADFDPGPRKFVRIDPGDKGIYVSKFDQAGTWLWSWVPRNGEEDDTAEGIGVDGDAGAFVVGEFGLTVDFDPEGEGDPRTSVGGSDFYVAHLGGDGSYAWTVTAGSTWLDSANGISVDPDGRILFGGQFHWTIDFDPTEGIDNHTSDAHTDYFTSRWYCGACPAIYAHRAEGGAGQISVYLHTTTPGGRALVRCRGRAGQGTFDKNAWLDWDGKLQTVIAPVPPGKYTCAVQKLRSAGREVQCPRRASPRRVVVE
ncbi:MAG: hypothetical protein C4547_02600 [Phycisphaerales bacterium]|nr:MAG: hypothetical protein C4547_02600 [Phycisphaerales bacterium]